MKVVLLNIWILLAMNAWSQSAEVYIQHAKKSAQAGNYHAAHLSIDSLLSKVPVHTEGLKYKANLYSWEKKNDSAIQIIMQVPSFKSDVEANYLSAVYLFRSQRLAESLTQCQQSLALKPTYSEAQLLELDILLAMKNYKEAFEKSKRIKDTSSKAKYIHQLAASKYLSTRITVGLNTTLQANALQHRYLVQGQFTKNRFTSVSTINYATQNISGHIQFVEELYKSWKKYGYSYGSVSFSKSTLFPLLSLSAVHFTPVYKTVEMDLGIRYYQGQNGQKSLVPSLGAAYSINKMAMHYRYYHVFGNRSSGATHTLSIRRFLNQAEDFIRFDMSIGNQFDLYNRANTEYTLNTKGYTVGVGLHKSLNARLKTNIGVLYSNSTINESNTRTSLTTTINLTYKLRSL